uniref:Transporter n=1 Tax=Sphaeramia orbicularis TaxID=375764 RepID=A0A673BEN7_9TELE
MSEETVTVGDSQPDKRHQQEEVPSRGRWANNREFILTMAGEIVGLGNIWRFPYLCYKNGGGAFLIPYFFFLFFCGIPLFFLETALGQYTSEGGITAWQKICPMFEGVGIASQVMVTYGNIYYIVILAWGILYLISSFKSPVPWSTCENAWNTFNCHTRPSMYANPHLFNPNFNWSFLHNFTCFTVMIKNYLIHRVLQMSGDRFFGNLNWDLSLCLLLAWIICYFCIWKGVKSIGKVVHFTAIFPYLLLFILFVRGVTLPGAGEGIKYYFMPDISRIGDPHVWCDAVREVLFSYAVCHGVFTAMGSYNKYNNNCFRDCLALCCLNSATSIFAGFAVFSILGFMAHDLGARIEDVAVSGLGLAFIAFPKALTLLPVSSFWLVLFFLMILLLALDTHFVCVESLATAITDLFPHFLRRPGRREILVLVIAVVSFLLGLPFVTQNGILFFYIIDSYGSSSISLLFIAIFETVVIGWVYGADRFYDNIEDMIGYAPFRVLKYCWLFVTPLICGITLLYELATMQPYFPMTGYVLEPWGRGLAALFVLTPLICIPLFIFRSLCKNSKTMTTPSSDLRQAQPHKPVLTLCEYIVFKAQVQPKKNVERNNEKMEMEEPV